MEIKVSCPCGQHYAFDVEPVNNAMPAAVNCPACGADGTQLANEFIAGTVAVGAPAAPATAGLRINRSAETTAAPAAPPQKFYSRAVSGVPDKAPPPSQENVPMGVLGGVIAGAIGMLIWYGLSISTGHRLGAVAWGVGVITGVGVRVLGRDGSSLLGVIAAICAGAAILGGQFWT